MVTWGVEKVDAVVVIFELEDGRGDRNATLLLHAHPVTGGGLLLLLGGDTSRKTDGTPVEEEFLGEGGFSGIGVGNDGEGAAA